MSGKLADDIRRLAALERRVTGCRRCPRLVEWRELVAHEKRAAFRDEQYWGRPLPGFGDPAARVAVIGLAPAAHGGNRTGRVFTGDRSGDWLFGSLHRTGFANQPTSVRADDGLRLEGAFVAAAVRCAPSATTAFPTRPRSSSCSGRRWSCASARSPGMPPVACAACARAPASG